jgi:hypothetical protein
MAIDTRLGDLAEKFRKLLGLQGEPTPKFIPDVQAVIVAMDGTGPLSGGTAGRRFFGHQNIVGASEQHMLIIALEPVIIDGLFVELSSAGAANLILEYFGSGDTKPFTPGGPACFIADYARSFNEAPQILSAQAAAQANPSGFLFYERTFSAAQTNSPNPIVVGASGGNIPPIPLQAGAAVVVRGVSTSLLKISWSGYTRT